MRLTLVVVVLVAACASLHAQNAVVQSLRVGTGPSAMTFVAPTDLTSPIQIDLTELGDLANGTHDLQIEVTNGTLKFIKKPDPVIVRPQQYQISEDMMIAPVNPIVQLAPREVDQTNIVRIPATSGLLVHVEQLSMPKFNEYEQHTMRVSIPGALKGAAVVATPQSHLPSGFVVNYATCIEDGVVELRIVNLTVDCITPAPTTFSFAVVNATASRR